jgi:hypothetical protein
VSVQQRLMWGACTQGSHVLFVTNCHATPWQAHIHRRDVQLSFLDCSPPGHHPAVLALNAPGSSGLFHTASKDSSTSEQDVFYAAPDAQLFHVFGQGNAPSQTAQKRLEQSPSHLVMYDDMLGQVKEFLEAWGYVSVAEFSQNMLEGRRVLILSRQSHKAKA